MRMAELALELWEAWPFMKQWGPAKPEDDEMSEEEWASIIATAEEYWSRDDAI